MHVKFGQYHVSDIEFVAAFDVDAKKVGRDLSEAIGASENNTIKIADVPAVGRTGAARPHPRRSRQVLPRDDRGVRRASRWTSSRRSRRQRRRARSATCPSAPRHAAKFYAQCAIDAKVAFVNALPVFIAGTPEWAREVRRRRCPDRRRRHQEPGRRDHHPPRAGQAVRGPRRRGAAHLAAQRRRQHGLHEHARARPPGVEEDLQDPVGHLAGPRPRPGQAQRAHRPVGLRRLARRPQVGLRPARGQDVRRRAAEPGVQARGLGLARTPPASSSTRCAARRSPWTAASAARSCRRRATS